MRTQMKNFEKLIAFTYLGSKLAVDGNLNTHSMQAGTRMLNLKCIRGYVGLGLRKTGEST